MGILYLCIDVKYVITICDRREKRKKKLTSTTERGIKPDDYPQNYKKTPLQVVRVLLVNDVYLV